MLEGGAFVSGVGVFVCFSAFQNKILSALLRRKMPQLARLRVEPGIPEIKRRLLARKRAPEIRLSFRDYTPRAGASVERDRASCFPCFVGQVRYLRGHSRPPLRKANGELDPVVASGVFLHRNSTPGIDVQPA